MPRYAITVHRSVRVQYIASVEITAETEAGALAAAREQKNALVWYEVDADSGVLEWEAREIRP